MSGLVAVETATSPGEREDEVDDAARLVARLERHRPELTHHCRRLLGSSVDAEDAVQETLVRAWRSSERFQSRCSLRTWLYRIATNVCLDMLGRRQRQPWPVDHTASQDQSCAPPEDDPAERAASREAVREAVMATLVHLPPRQRAVLLLCEVLRWRATEAAELLGTSVASVNSALQRARATLGALELAAAPRARPTDRAQHGLLDRCVDAFERHDLDSLVTLLAQGSDLERTTRPVEGRPDPVPRKVPERV